MNATFYLLLPLRRKAVIFTMTLLAFSFALRAQLLDPATQPKFMEALPNPSVINARNGGFFTIKIGETYQWLGLRKPNGKKMPTKVWGYGLFNGNVTYPGPTLLAAKNVPVDIKWDNKLPDGHMLPVDHSIHLAHLMKPGIPVVTHLHGGHTESASDGLPDAWFTQGFKETGPGWVKKNLHYDNDQEAATLWYHDHALGYTRLNVYAGLAGFYLLTDANEQQLINNGVLPSGNYERGIVIQDRMFMTNGDLFYPSADPMMLPPSSPTPSVLPEFFGNFIVVNGMIWPKLTVEPRKYRFRFLNGSDSRFYILRLSNGANFMQIGTDEGLLPFPVTLNELLLGPGERADLIVDFSGASGNIVLQNFGPDGPFKGAADPQPPADPNTTGSIMQFSVTQPLSPTPNATVTTATALRPAIAPLVQTGATRQLVLFEGLDQFGRLQPLLGTLAEGSKAWFEPVTENPMLNDVEVWEVYNATPDAHPIHLHLVSFQIINREDFTGNVIPKPQIQHDGTTGEGGILQLTGLLNNAQPPAPNEKGWKDTAVMPPGKVTRVIAKFDRAGLYVWHCHILSHEDHEMMRPYQVMTPGIPLVVPPASTFNLFQNEPNPFGYVTNISFSVAKEEPVSMRVLDMQGRLIRELAGEEIFPAGRHTITWDGADASGNLLPDGLYFCHLTTGGLQRVQKMMLQRP